MDNKTIIESDKMIFDYSVTNDWIMEAIKEYAQQCMPYGRMIFMVIDINNNVKFFNSIVNLITQPFNYYVNEIGKRDNIKFIIAPISNKYNGKYFENILLKYNIHFKYDVDENNIINLFI